MSQHNLIALIKNRLDQADQSLEAARTLLDQKLYRDSINRSYYAIDDAGQALTRAREFVAQIKPYLSDMVGNSHLS